MAISPTLAAGELGVAYTPVTLGASGGTPPYKWDVSGGALPGGLTLASNGAFSGTPTAAGGFSFQVHVQDLKGATSEVPASITIINALTAALIPVCAHGCHVEQGCVDVCGSFGTVAGGMPPYKYQLKSGSLPGGTSLGGTALAGTFNSTGNYSFTVQVTDALGATASVAATFSVFPHIYFYCPSTWPGGRGGCIPPGGGSGAYNGGLTFLCTQVADHPDCSGYMTFAGGSTSGWTVTYKAVSGMRPPAGFSAPDPAAVPPPPWWSVDFTMPAPPTAGATAYGTVLVTLSDSMVCGPGGTRCSTSAYVTWSVQNRNQ